MRVAIAYHSGYGHTERQAQAVAEGVNSVAGVEADLISVEDLVDTESPAWAKLDQAGAIIFGSPTYMGSASAAFKGFMDATSARWMEQKWAHKIAAGFTNSGSQNGDKQNTLIQFCTLAAQHGMVWVNLNLMPGNNHSGGSKDDLNQLGASLGAMAQSNVDVDADTAPGKSDLKTAAALGANVANAALRWNKS
jgi:NAD(P)H dehydrogenase (quinone)